MGAPLQFTCLCRGRQAEAGLLANLGMSLPSSGIQRLHASKVCDLKATNQIMLPKIAKMDNQIPVVSNKVEHVTAIEMLSLNVGNE